MYCRTTLYVMQHNQKHPDITDTQSEYLKAISRQVNVYKFDNIPGELSVG